MSNVIDSFEGEYSFLGNFWLCNVTRAGLVYPSVENAYQSAKVKDNEERIIFTILSPAKSKKEIHSEDSDLDLIKKFDLKKDDVMFKLLQQKFQKGKWERCQLDRTEGIELIEGNALGDVYWGVCNGVGENKLGRMLMDIRDN